MKFYVICDSIDTLYGMRMVGVEGVVVHERNEVLKHLEKILHNPSVGIVMITSKLVESCRDVINELKRNTRVPLIVEIPDAQGKDHISETLNEYVASAIGMKL